jgi:hypothetical protein
VIHRRGVSNIAEYEQVITLRINHETAEGIEYLRSVIRDGMSMEISRSLIIRTLIQDAVRSNKSQQYYRQHKTHNRQESTDELGK